MIKKELAREIYNIYSQIETCDKLIADLEGFVKACDGNVPDLIDKDYCSYGSIQISIPYFDKGKFKTDGGARLFNINYSLALKVIKSHKRTLKNLLKKLDEEL
ncbi:MAG: hypothetical protein J6T22_09320 [Bacteroidales bacterium]|nr:hypothetical protein [Bacteroidales bacterium]MBO7617393.1 hypothetical protein [Bacteroidales bacterium]